MQQYGRDRIGTRRMTDDAPVAPEGAYSMRARILGSMVSRQSNLVAIKLLLVLPRHSSLSDSIEEDCESGAGQSASTEGVDGQLLLLDIEL
ncbi:hypothetical protein MCOR27_008474 [Pyricularia oryzae]|nr:hypothetical protein MCOR01_009924 [Pyricularia oryzae]KAI6272207.1 hypothetical protein MCOR27_008474 [Pyricularia oryzae]KAI6310307.1 hypothetical protein MCOR34_006449 [Pyricularia oryzae]KAI6329405.1 hypothetical protein MCOR30_005630 [Pyricularia oryzae]KAI6338608.1 hypothetical protein MCOR28_007822 [Pyricularia oryzae]